MPDQGSAILPLWVRQAVFSRRFLPYGEIQIMSGEGARSPVACLKHSIPGTALEMQNCPAL